MNAVLPPVPEGTIFGSVQVLEGNPPFGGVIIDGAGQDRVVIEFVEGQQFTIDLTESNQ